jgi:CRISPR-associated DxTHG motif protein
VIILTTIGTGNYTDETYEFQDKPLWTTKLFPIALAGWYPEASIKVLATAEAGDKYRDEILQALPRAEIIRIPSCKAEDELWELFNTIARELPDAETVVLDITHGYRSLPQLALLSLAFLRVAKGIKIERVVYGALDAKSAEGVCPVFDLTPFVDMLDWANATDRFLDTGDARKLTPLISKQSRNPLNDVAKRMAGLSEALLLNRAELILKESRALRNKIADARDGDFEPQFAPFRYLIDVVDERIRPIAAPSDLCAQLAQIEWLAKHGHYPAAASLAREWLVSVRIEHNGGKVFPVALPDRTEAETWLTSHIVRDGARNGVDPPAEWRPVVELWRNLADMRNDLMHFGMRSGPRKPATIKQFITDLPDMLRLAVSHLYPEGGQ